MAQKPALIVSPFDVERDFHAPDFKRAKIKTARLAYRHKIEKKEGEPPVVTFTMPRPRAFAPQFTRRALRNYRQATGLKSPAKIVAFVQHEKIRAEKLRLLQTQARQAAGARIAFREATAT